MTLRAHGRARPDMGGVGVGRASGGPARRRGRREGGARWTDSVLSFQPNTFQCFINRKDCK